MPSIQLGFPGNTSGKESTCQYRRLRFNPWVRKIPWRRKWQPTSLFLPRKSYGQRRLEGYSPWGHRVRHDWAHTRRGQRPHMLRGAANTNTHTHSTQNSYKITGTMRTAEERSVQFSHSVMSNYSRWPRTAAHQVTLSINNPRNLLKFMSIESVMHPTVSHSVMHFSSCLQSFPASACFLVHQSFASGEQSTGASALASVLPKNTQDWFPSGWTDLISLQSKGVSRIFSNTTVQMHQFFSPQLSLWSDCQTWLLEKPVLIRRTFVGKVMPLLLICCLGWS